MNGGHKLTCQSSISTVDNDLSEVLKDQTKVRVRKPVKKTEPQLLALILAELEEAKAEEIVTIALDKKMALADYMVIASGRVARHVNAIADRLIEKLKEHGVKDLRLEGIPQCDWVLVDAGDVMVHLFRPEVRSFYNLEKLWSEQAPLDQSVG